MNDNRSNVHVLLTDGACSVYLIDYRGVGHIVQITPDKAEKLKYELEVFLHETDLRKGDKIPG